jgi:hypothetical protein
MRQNVVTVILVVLHVLDIIIIVLVVSLLPQETIPSCILINSTMLHVWLFARLQPLPSQLRAITEVLVLWSVTRALTNARTAT